jgi:hypothetical protein
LEDDAFGRFGIGLGLTGKQLMTNTYRDVPSSSEEEKTRRLFCCLPSCDRFGLFMIDFG